MSFSKVVKGEGIEGVRTLRFVDFDNPGSDNGLAPAGDEFEATGVVSGKTAHPPALPAEVVAIEVERARAEAFARGRQAGREEAEERFGETVRAFSAGLEGISRLRESLLKNGTDDMLRLVMAVAEQVIACELATNPEVVLHVLQKALHAAVRADTFHVRVNPDDFALVQERKPLLLAGISGLKNIVFEADAAIARGGCLIDSELGEVDATLDSQLEEMRQKIRLAAMGE